MIQTLVYQLHDLIPYINWLYFFHAWGMPSHFSSIADIHDCMSCQRAWLESRKPAERAQASEALRLYKEASVLLRQLDGTYKVYARFGLFSARSDGEDIYVKIPESVSTTDLNFSSETSTLRIPFLRQQKSGGTDTRCLCLSDFIAPKHYFENVPSSFPSVQEVPRGLSMGCFVTAVEENMENLLQEDLYGHMLVQTLCDRLAEAAAEKMHEEIRKKYWGYSPSEHFSVKDLFLEKYEGKRPAVGYPSIPDQSINRLIDELIHMDAIGVRLTANCMMQPHAAVSGFLFDHPSARHFSVGAIGEDQLRNYALRRGFSVSECRKFLAENLRNRKK